MKLKMEKETLRHLTLHALVGRVEVGREVRTPALGLIVAGARAEPGAPSLEGMWRQVGPFLQDPEITVPGIKPSQIAPPVSAAPSSQVTLPNATTISNG